MPGEAAPLGSVNPVGVAPFGEQFSETDADRFYRLVAARRDVRHFVPGAQVPADTLQRLLAAAHQSPSVGLMQPWRFVRILDADLRLGIAALVEQERVATAAALGERAAEFLRLKVEGVRECSVLLVAALAPDDGTVFGRRTMPREMALCSLACAVQNMWLAARVENLGLGWVSMFDPPALARLLRMPAGAAPLAVLCIGQAERFEDRPLLEIEQWRQRRPFTDVLYTDAWGRAPS